MLQEHLNFRLNQKKTYMKSSTLEKSRPIRPIWKWLTCTALRSWMTHTLRCWPLTAYTSSVWLSISVSESKGHLSRLSFSAAKNWKHYSFNMQVGPYVFIYIGISHRPTSLSLFSYVIRSSDTITNALIVWNSGERQSAGGMCWRYQ